MGMDDELFISYRDGLFLSGFVMGCWLFEHWVKFEKGLLLGWLLGFILDSGLFRFG